MKNWQITMSHESFLFLPPATKSAQVLVLEGCLVLGVLVPGGAWSWGGLVPWGCLVEIPPWDGHCCGLYASYWNAFLLNAIFTQTPICTVGFNNSIFVLNICSLQNLKLILKFMKRMTNYYLRMVRSDTL